MSETQEIEVQIDDHGNVRIEVHGVSGKKCEDLTALLEQALGGQVLERVHKSEYHAQSTGVADTVSASHRD